MQEVCRDPGHLTQQRTRWIQRANVAVRLRRSVMASRWHQVEQTPASRVVVTPRPVRLLIPETAVTMTTAPPQQQGCQRIGCYASVSLLFLLLLLVRDASCDANRDRRSVCHAKTAGQDIPVAELAPCCWTWVDARRVRAGRAGRVSRQRRHHRCRTLSCDMRRRCPRWVDEAPVGDELTVWSRRWTATIVD